MFPQVGTFTQLHLPTTISTRPPSLPIPNRRPTPMLRLTSRPIHTFQAYQPTSTARHHRSMTTVRWRIRIPIEHHRPNTHLMPLLRLTVPRRPYTTTTTIQECNLVLHSLPITPTFRTRPNHTPRRLISPQRKDGTWVKLYRLYRQFLPNTTAIHHLQPPFPPHHMANPYPVHLRADMAEHLIGTLCGNN